MIITPASFLGARASGPRAGGTPALQDLAAEYAGTPRSETARLREVLDDVEAALTVGASHAAVLDTLHAHGFSLTAPSFESTLARLRRERRGQDEIQESAQASRRRA